MLLEDPAAAQVWALEISEKTGLSQILEHRRHPLLAAQWPGMVLPWTLIAPLAVLLPFFLARRDRTATARCGVSPTIATDRRTFGSPGGGAVGNLAVFCFWSVAKPNYYVPCLPGMALLIGAAWVELAQAGRRPAKPGPINRARSLLQAQWVLFFVAAVGGPGRRARSGSKPTVWPWCLAIGAGRCGRGGRKCSHVEEGRRLDRTCAACGGVRGRFPRGVRPNRSAGERRSAAIEPLAEKLGRIVSGASSAPTLMFFNEIDEGLWFYAKGFRLAPCRRLIPATTRLSTSLTAF